MPNEIRVIVEGSVADRVAWDTLKARIDTFLQQNPGLKLVDRTYREVG